LSNNEPLNLNGNCNHCGKDLSKQDWVQIAGQKVFCNERCSQRTNYGITGEDGYTRISSRKEDLPSIEGREIVEVE